MIEVSINKFSHHAGYHYELLNCPPRNIRYYPQRCDERIPMEAVFNEPDHGWKRFKQYTRFETSYDYVPQYSHPRQLIHSHIVPVVDKKNYIVDCGEFFYPYLVDYVEFERIKRLEATWPTAHHLNTRTLARLERTKELLRSRFCRKILPWSKACRDYILGFIDDPRIVEKIEVVYPAVHNATVYRKRNRKCVSLLFICSSFFARKGGDDVLRAFDCIRRRCSAVELIWVGAVPGDIYSKYKRYRDIHFHPYVPKDYLFKLYMKSDIFVLPTRFDTFGMSILEAMNFRLPVITTKGKTILAAEEIVQDGVSGFLIGRRYDKNTKHVTGELELNGFIDKIMVLIEDIRLRETMGSAGKDLIASGKFSIKKRNERLRQIYENAL